LCRQNEIEIAGTHVAWDRFRYDIDRVIEEHKLWGCRHTAVGSIPARTYLSLAGLETFIEEATPVAEKLADAGIDFSYHNHNHEFLHFDGKPWLAHLYDVAPATVIKAELDTHWIVAGGGDPVEWINACGDRMPLLHLKDYALSSDFQRVFAAIGKGNMNWNAIIGTAMLHPVEYYFVEQDNCYGEDEFECLAQSYETLADFGLS
jgi:sugar phosphate isomerase/epimerase